MFFDDCDGLAAYNERGSYAIIQGPRRTRMSGTVTNFDVPCKDGLILTPVEGFDDPLEQCDILTMSQFKASQRLVNYIWLFGEQAECSNVHSKKYY